MDQSRQLNIFHWERIIPNHEIGRQASTCSAQWKALHLVHWLPKSRLTTFKESDLKKQTADKLFRWALTSEFSAMLLSIYPGKAIFWADMLSWWMHKPSTASIWLLERLLDLCLRTISFGLQYSKYSNVKNNLLSVAWRWLGVIWKVVNFARSWQLLFQVNSEFYNYCGVPH